MSYHYDWLMRQIEAISTMLGYILFGKSIPLVAIEEQQPTVPDGNELHLRLHALVVQKQICQAENLLYEALGDPDRQVLEAAKLFYDELNQLSDEELQQCNFSRGEICEGLQHVCNVFGIPM